MAISYVGAGTDFQQASGGTGYTINRPASVTTGDIMIAVAAIDTYPTTASSLTINNPSGWTTISTVTANSYLRFRVMYKVHDGSEPTSWSGTLSGSCPHRTCVSVAYRGADSIDDTSSGTTGSGTSVSTGTATNPSATSWRLSAGAYVSSTASSSISSSGVTERADAVAEGGGTPGAVEVSFGDSNGTIGTGNTSRTYTRGASWESAGAWIGILLSEAGEAVTGEFEVNPLPLPEFDADAELSYSASLDADLLMPTMEAEGIATPPEGTLEVLILPTMSASGVQEAAGSLEVMAGPIVSINAETRHFGVRVVTPEAETRTVTPRLGASD